MCQHTPAPWEITKHATPEYAPQFGVYAEGQVNDLATVVGPNAKADAQLIAAAPQLLAACKLALKAENDRRAGIELEDADYAELHQALSQATREATQTEQDHV